MSFFTRSRNSKSRVLGCAASLRASLLVSSLSRYERVVTTTKMKEANRNARERST